MGALTGKWHKAMASNGDAAEIVRLAWDALPDAHRALLEAVGCEQVAVDGVPLGRQADLLRLSAGMPALRAAEIRYLDQCLGAWISELRLMLINSEHEALDGLDESSFEAAIARVAWHEWGHALSLHSATPEDVAQGERLLAMAPRGIADGIRAAEYGPSDVVHELVAEIYALLLARRQRGMGGKPEWLAQELWDLVTRVIPWSP